MNTADELSRALDRILRDPDNARLYNDAAVCLYQMGDLKNAGRYGRRAFKLCRTDEDILYNYAVILSRLCCWRDAACVCQLYLELDEKNTDMTERLAELYYQLGDYEKAAGLYENLRPEGEGSGNA